MLLIDFENVKKSFGGLEALKGVNLSIHKGEIFGLLGLNGAGKTTLIRCLLGLLKVNSGMINFSGRPRKTEDIHKHFGFLPENFFPPKNIKAREFLKTLSWGLGIKPGRADFLLKMVGLKDQAQKYMGAYSRGMIQRLGLAVCLLKDPAVIVLDEPTLGLDVLGQRRFLNLLIELNKQGKTVFFSSHILSQIERICSRIGVIHSGVIKFAGGIEGMINKHKVFSLENAFLREIETNAAALSREGK